jgi:hypothetical protein
MMAMLKPIKKVNGVLGTQKCLLVDLVDILDRFFEFKYFQQK